jgi:chromosome segregation protein
VSSRETTPGAPGLRAAGTWADDGWTRPVMPAIELVKAPGELEVALERLLAGVLVAPDLATGLELVLADPAVAVVTADGDLIGAHWARGGSASGQSLLGLRAAAQQAAEQLADAEVAAQRAERELTEAIEDEDNAKQALAHSQAAMAEVDAAAAEISGRLGTLAGAARAAQDEAGRLAASIAAADRSAEKSRSQLAEIEARIAAESSRDRAPDDGTGELSDDEASSPRASTKGSPSHSAKQALSDSAAAARSTEMDARLEVRTVEERLRAISGRADALASSALTERQAIARAGERARRRSGEAKVAHAVAEGATTALAAIERSLMLADTERQQAETAHQGRDEELKTVRTRIREASAQLDKVVNTAHGAEVARASRRMKLEQVESKAADEFAVDVEVLVAEYGPDVPVQPADGDQPALPFDRETQRRRAEVAQRQLDQLGKVNPLALEEFAALEERHAFLVTQLDDLRKTRRDLLTVVKEVDDRVQQVFADAFADTAREFEQIFARMFPGGDGKLILTEPDDMLSTGIEFEARPPGKKVKRLSLLSGGERSLTAIAFLVSIFKARPSPFYVMDEVEAALDDTNVQRVLDVFDELRASSQLIIVTHQKRTMEIADCLYGITMQSDGVSAVISQRLREREPA